MSRRYLKVLLVALVAAGAMTWPAAAPLPGGAVVAFDVPGRTDATPSVAADRAFVALAWGASADGKADVFVATSRDGGRAFGAPVQVNRTQARVVWAESCRHASPSTRSPARRCRRSPCCGMPAAEPLASRWRDPQMEAGRSRLQSTCSRTARSATVAGRHWRSTIVATHTPCGSITVDSPCVVRPRVRRRSRDTMSTGRLPVAIRR